MSDKVNLFQSDSSDSEGEDELRINQQYANAYDQWREKEALQRYKDLQEEVSTSSSESEDEDEPVFDENFFRVLSLIKSENPKIYDPNFVAFPEPAPVPKIKSKEAKPVNIKDYEVQVALETNGDIEEKATLKKKTNEAELAKLKNAIMDDDSDDDDEDCIKSLAPKEKSVDEPEGVIKFLKGGDADIPDDAKKDLSYLREYWNDPNLDEGEKFIRDYMLDKTYLKKDDNFQVLEEMDRLSEDERFEEAQEQFEHKYNYRFEEPDAEFIKRYPRTVGESLRRKDSRRKEKREEYAERKQREKEQKREELKRLKAVKRKEIENKFFKLQEVTGKDDINFDEDDIESDFDPDKHDRKMKELFDDDYYNVEEQQKPVFEYDEEIDDEDWNHWTRGKRTGAQEGDEEDESVATANTGDYTDGTQDMDTRNLFVKEMIERSTDRRRKGRKKSLFARLLSNPKPLYDPKGKSFDEYLEEYYNLDCEDVISDMPVKFKYRKVVPNDFGLSVDEILKADDKELNRWCSIKKTCQYRQKDEEMYDVQAYQKKSQQIALKQKVLPSVYAEPKEENSETEEKITESSAQKKKKRKKKKAKIATTDENSEETQPKIEVTEDEVSLEIRDLTDADCVKSKNKHKKKKSKKIQIINEGGETESVSENNESFNNVSVEDEADVTFDNSNSFSAEDTEKPVAGSKRKRKKSKKNKRNTSNDANLDNETNFSEAAVNKSQDVSVDVSNDHDSIAPPTKKRRADSLHHDNSGIQPANQNKTGRFKGNMQSESAVDNSNRNAKKHKKNNSQFVSNYQQRGNNSYYASSKNQPVQGTDKRLALSDDRLAAYGINPKKFKNKMKYSKQSN